MTRGGTRPIAALVIAVLAAALLGACGEEGSDTTTTSIETSTTGQDAGGSSGQKSAQGGGSGSKQTGGSGSSQTEGDSGQVSTPLKVSGGGSEQFRFKGGDNSIQEYGEESDGSELEEVAEIVHGFYVARAEEDWGRACSYLAESMVSQLEELAAQSSKLRNKGCAAVLQAFTRPLPAQVRRETTVVDAGSFRRDDDVGFLIYYDDDDKPFAMPLRDEGGTWKLTLLGATPLG